jgi:hypothetical protein
VRVWGCLGKGPWVDDEHGEAEEGKGDFREQCGYV